MQDGTAIAVDAMSGDDGPNTAVPSVIEYLKNNKASKIKLVGDQKTLEALLHQYDDNLTDRISVVASHSVVTMDDKPSTALRKKQDSSMAIALGLVRSGDASACVSAGNTGALMALGRSILGMYPGIDRPAITKMFPSKSGGCYVLDLGANVDCSSEHLLQFAIMGSLLASALKGIEKPRVALLNIGGESIKGNEQVRLAGSLIEQYGLLNYVGFAEGGDIFKDKADVVVCDGFVGNAALKASEGAAQVILEAVYTFFSGNIFQRLLGKMLLPLMAPYLRHLDPDNHNGAMFLGLQGVVVKSHGHASVKAFQCAMEVAAKEAQCKVPQLINDQLDDMLV